MTVKLIIGPPSSGKTHRCIKRVLEIQSEKRMSPIWVVVPDRYQAYAFRRVLGAMGGAIGVHVGTFGSLYSEILWSAKKPIPLASDPIIYRLVRSALSKVESDQRLEHYAPIAEMPGFHRALRSIFAELKLARIWPDKFLAWAKDKGHALTEIAYVYAEYQTKLREIQWADQEGVDWLATEALEANQSLGSHWTLLVVDGFDSFEGAQRAALGLLSQRIPEMLITLPGEREMTRVAHRRFAKTFDQLKRDIPLEVEPISGESRLPPVLAHIEKSLFEPENSRVSPDGHVIMLEVQSPREEAREAVRWVKSRIVRANTNAYACAIVTPDPERYRPFLREAAHEFGVPLRFTQGEPLSSAPGITALLDLIELPQRNFPIRLTVEAIRTPYFDLSAYGLEFNDADPLENAGRHGLVIEGVDQWEEALSNLAGAESPSDREEQVQRIDLPRGEQALRLLNGLRQFVNRLTLPTDQTMQKWVNWLEDLLDDFQFLQVDQTNRDKASFLGLRDVLRALVLGEVVAGEQSIPPQSFIRTLRSFLESTYYHEEQKWKDPAVLVLRVLEARGLRYQSLALVGLAEGLFPEVEREDPFLNDEVRDKLGLERRLEREQGGLFYQIITRADQQILLTRPYLAEDGEYWEPSPYWTEVENLLESEPITLRHESPRALVNAASSSELLFWGVRSKQGLLPQFEMDLQPRWAYLEHAQNVTQARLQKTPEGPYEGIIVGLSAQLTDRYGPGHLWSSSRLEVYGGCPYRFYVESVNELEIKEFPELGIDASQLGSMLHRALELAYQRAADPSDSEQVLEVLGAVVDEVFSDAPARYGFRPTHLWDIEQAQFSQALHETVENLAKLGPGWRPIAYEHAFGIENVPALEMKVGDETIRVRGYIDRVDRNASGDLRVIDYKTGSSHLGPRDLIEGRRLQLPIYALAAGEVLDLGAPTDGFYWAILKGEAGRLRLREFQPDRDDPSNVGPNSAIATMKGHVTRYISAIRAGEFPPIPPGDGCPDYCAAAGWCWRYSPSGW